MQIILMEQIHNLGRLGDIVKVNQGFARNYLIPKGKAKRATAEAELAEVIDHFGALVLAHQSVVDVQQVQPFGPQRPGDQHRGDGRIDTA